MRNILVFSLLLTSAVTLSACGNTFHGMGRDLSEWGQTIQDTF